MNKNNKLKSPKFKINKKGAAVACGAAVLAVSAVIANINGSLKFDPSKFKDNDGVQVNQASFSDGAVSADDDGDSKKSDNALDGNINNLNNDDKPLFNQSKTPEYDSRVQNAVSKLAPDSDNKNAVAVGAGKSGGSNNSGRAIISDGNEANRSDNTDNASAATNSAENSQNSSNTKDSSNNGASRPSANDSASNKDSAADNENILEEIYDTGGSVPHSAGTVNTDNTDNKPDEPVNPDDTQDDKKDSSPETDPTPVLPEDLYSGLGIDTIDFLDTVDSGSSGGSEISNNGNIMITTDSFMGNFTNLYYGQELNDWTLLCSMYAYYTTDEGEIYRITDVNKDYFYFGDYPERAENDLEIDVYFRPNKNSEWQTFKAEFQVMPYKVYIKDTEGSTIDTKVLSEYDTVDLLDYYEKFNEKDCDISKLFIGWSDNADLSGEIYRSEFKPSKKGQTVLYALPVAELNDDNYKARLEMNWGNYFPDYLQTLYAYTGGDGIVNVPEGIQCVSLYDTINRLIAPSSVLDILYNNFGYECIEAYDIAQDNPNYSALNGILMNKDASVIYDIPKSITGIEVPDSVYTVNLRSDNNINNIVFNSPVPPTIDLSALNGATLTVPDEYYYDYLMEWGSKLNGNTLVSAGAAWEQFSVDADTISSADKTKVYSVLPARCAVASMPESVRTIASGAFKNNNNSAEIVVFQSGIENIEANAFSDSDVNKIIFKGETPPVITENTFDENMKVYVPLEYRQNYIDKWSEYIGAEACQRLISTEAANLHNDSSGSVILTIGQEDILVKLSDNVTVFDESYCRENSLNITKAANYAFADNAALNIAELPESIKEIGGGAFDGCSSLELAVIGSKDNFKFGENSFENCSVLKAIASNALNAEFENYYTIYLSTLFTVPNAVGYDYYWNLWDGSYYIKNVNGSYIMYGRDDNGYEVSNFVRGAILNNGNITFEDNTKEIGPSSFAGETDLEYVTLPDSLNIISDYAFASSSLKEITLPEAVNTLGYGVFSGCAELEKAVINCIDLYSLPSQTFAYCYKLNSVEFGESCGIKSVEYDTFNGCSMEKIIFPESLTDISSDAFTDAYNLRTIGFKSAVPPRLISFSPGIGFEFGSGVYEDLKIEVPEGSEESYIAQWRSQIMGYDESEMTEEQLLEGENKVRALLGLEPAEYAPAAAEAADEAYEPMTDETAETEETTEETTETAVTEAETEAETLTEAIAAEETEAAPAEETEVISNDN